MREASLPFNELLLDDENPRLPEKLVRASQPEILRYMYENAVLQELARSYVNNGFFQNEPLMATEMDGMTVVLEGNRRLAALKVLLQDEDALVAEVSFDDDLRRDLTPELEEELRQPLPIYVVESREEVRKYLGFRHIGGTKSWSAEAKARYLADEVIADRGEPNPFVTVARRVGSNAMGVRNAYIAITVLRYARDELSINVDAVQQSRFGVWARALNAPDLREYIGLGDPRTVDEIDEGVRAIDNQRLREVLRDLVPQGESKRPLLADSRQVTVYAQALKIPAARAAIQDYGDFELARQIVEQENLPGRLDGIARSLKVILNEVTQADSVAEQVVPSAQMSPRRPPR